MSSQDDYSNTCAFFILIFFDDVKVRIKWQDSFKSFFFSLPAKHYAEDCIPPFSFCLLLCSIHQKWGESKQTIQGEQSAVHKIWMKFVKSILIFRLRSSQQPWATGETGGRRPSVQTTPGHRDSSSRQGLRLIEWHDWGWHLGGKWPRRSGWWHSSGWGQARVLWCKGSFYWVCFEVIRCRHCINS